MLCKILHHEATAAAAPASLEHEYTLLRNLSVPGVVRVHDLLPFDKGACLILEDQGAVPLRTLLSGQPLDLPAFAASLAKPSPPSRMKLWSD